MSTLSGFILGALTAAALTVYYGEQLAGHLQAVLDQPQPVVLAGAPVMPGSNNKAAADAAQPVPQTPPQTPAPAVPQEPVAATPSGPSLEQHWAEFAAQADALLPAGEFPWRACFQRAAASHELPESLLLAIASGESNFDPAARSDKDAIGLMQIRWPHTSRHLGVRREADLYDPCTNVDAGARYLAELAEQFNDNLHLAVAAYNYGPARIDVGKIPEGARWYSQYIYQHLQQVLGKGHIATSALLPAGVAEAGRQVLMRFNQPYRARDFIDYLRGQVPDLNLQQQSEALGLHEVVLLYRSEAERQRALDSISASGVATLSPQSTGKLSL